MLLQLIFLIIFVDILEIMDEITINGLTFEPYISKEKIDRRVGELAAEIERDFAGGSPLFVCILTGAFPFAADLFRAVRLDSEIAFVKLKSYEGTGSTGTVKQMLGLNEDIEGRDVIIVEDIVDTGVTMSRLLEDLAQKDPRNLKVATLLHKPEALKRPVKLDYVGFAIPNKFIIGYGLDLDGKARNLNDIYILKESLN